MRQRSSIGFNDLCILRLCINYTLARPAKPLCKVAHMLDRDVRSLRPAVRKLSFASPCHGTEDFPSAREIERRSRNLHSLLPVIELDCDTGFSGGDVLRILGEVMR